ncbi:hypothetical protein PN498_16230 [Oscillatoria sp. CS-180]|uniref:hypothetical protein n=1 Tax=Oscillatoria sp. CS-180 TaxID=3021720 RepID=UPI00232FEDCE|nr:hypothetical protein [Oscillatoria sp. CS-180]MDB9527547.1 hypothetical protein [Oscillatoria sp. CS-180]
MSFRRSRPQASSKKPLDTLSFGLMAGLIVASILLVVLGDHATAKVQKFSWQERTVGADNPAFVMTFSRPMDTQSVEANLQITPHLPGRVSWAGRRMAYTLDVPVPYGESYSVQIPEARDRFSEGTENGEFETFEGTFQSRDRAMIYIGTTADQTGRLVMVNFSQGGESVLLTPPGLTVLDFEPYPLGDRVLFSAVQQAEQTDGVLAPALYTVATGLTPNPPELSVTAEAAFLSQQPDEVGVITPVLESEQYQNLAFDLSPDGKLIVVQRVSTTDPADFGPWIVPEAAAPYPLETEPGGEFLIGPDSQSLLLLQGQGTAVIPLASDAENAGAVAPLDFLPEFGRVFDISHDGSSAAMVDFNQNDPERRFTETLVVVTNQGEETEILNATGSILAAEFDPTDRILYVLASELLPREAYQEQPYVTAINLETQESVNLLTLPPQSRVSMDISPDGLAALVEVALMTPDDVTTATEVEQTLLLPLFETTDQRLLAIPTQTAPQILPSEGTLPTWLP